MVLTEFQCLFKPLRVNVRVLLVYPKHLGQHWRAKAPPKFLWTLFHPLLMTPEIDRKLPHQGVLALSICVPTSQQLILHQETFWEWGSDVYISHQGHRRQISPAECIIGSVISEVNSVLNMRGSRWSVSRSLDASVHGDIKQKIWQKGKCQCLH